MLFKLIIILVLALILFRMVFKRRPRGEKARFLDILAGKEDRVRPRVVLAGAALLAAAAAIPALWRSLGAAGHSDLLDQLMITAAIAAAAGGVYLLALSAVTAWRRRRSKTGA